MAYIGKKNLEGLVNLIQAFMGQMFFLMKQGDCKFYFFVICNLVEEVLLCDFESMWYRNYLVLQVLFKGFILVCVCDFLHNVKRYEHDFTSKPIEAKLYSVLWMLKMWTYHSWIYFFPV